MESMAMQMVAMIPQARYYHQYSLRLARPE